MTLSQNTQEDSGRMSERESILLQIKEIKKLKNYEIAEILGLEAPETLSRSESKTLIAALRLLLNNLQLQQRIDRITQAQSIILNEVSSAKTEPYLDVTTVTYLKPPPPPSSGRTKKGRA